MKQQQVVECMYENLTIISCPKTGVSKYTDRSILWEKGKIILL